MKNPNNRCYNPISFAISNEIKKLFKNQNISKQKVEKTHFNRLFYLGACSHKIAMHKKIIIFCQHNQFLSSCIRKTAERHNLN